MTVTALDDRDECLIGATVGARPQILDQRTAERELDAADRAAAQGPRCGRGERLQLWGQALLEHPGDVDVGVELIHEVVGRAPPDVGVL